MSITTTTTTPTSQRNSEIDTLIVVCCHAIYLGGKVGDEKNWLIEPFQAGETTTFTKHIEEGINLLSQHGGRAILAFSGGATKRRKIRELKKKGLISQDINEDRTEAESYEDVAIAQDYFSYLSRDDTRLQACIFKEGFATDSYQNILLALLQYPIWKREVRRKLRGQDHESTSAQEAACEAVRFELPQKLVIVSHEFKRARFVDLHVPAITTLLRPLAGDSGMDVEYVGINPPFDDEKMAQIKEGDQLRGYGVWATDLHGTGDLLSRKRVDRGWDAHNFLNGLGACYERETMSKIESIVNGKQ